MNMRFASRRLWRPIPALTLIFVVCLVPLPVSISVAQNTGGGALEGKALDPQGAGVPGAKVTVTRPDGRSVSVTTNEEGYFRIPQLNPGRYTVTVEGAPGFARFEQANVEVSPSKTTNLTVNVRAANVSETVTVTQSSTAQVDVASPSLSERRITELPLTAQNYANLALLSPSVKPVNNPGNVTTSGGLWTVTFDTQPEKLRLYLPDDMRPGDTVSGTLVAEPKGSTDTKLPENKAQDVTFKLPSNSSGLSIGLLDPNTRKQVSSANIVLIPNYVFGGSAPADPSFSLPPFGQQGRLLEIPGRFDGNASNTTLWFVPPGGNLQDFEKSTQNVSGGYGVVRPVAESPRKIIFESPVDLTGLADLVLKERDATTRGPYRNLSVRLSAPKTNLLRGERTTLTVEVRGLEGIKEDVPLQLDAKGVITMDGGMFQNLRIKPQEVKQDGTYTTNRGITGQQAGGFNVTATVIVNRFDFFLQDDTDPNRIFHFNSFTGDYVFACGGGSCGTGGTTTGGTAAGGSGTPPPVTPPTGLNLTGIGKPAMKGCIITLSHNAPDRRVFARLDACTKTGDASVETTSPKTKINLTDKNTADNTAPSPPPK